MHLISLQLYIIVVYRPPSYTQLENDYLVNFLSEFCSNKHVIILGDFNLPAVDWAEKKAMFKGYDSSTQCFLDCFITLGLKQWVNFPTFHPSGNILNLVFTSDLDRVGTVTSLCPMPGCSHLPVLLDYFSCY